MIYSGRVDNFYLTAEQLAASPSRADGVDEASERELRRYCCDVVAEAAVLLRLPQVVAATAQVLVQRFYCKRSLKAFDVKVRPFFGCKRETFGDGPGLARWQPALVPVFWVHPPEVAAEPYLTLLPPCLLRLPSRRWWPWQLSGWPASWRR
jgi:hypothetical protein